MLDQVRCLQFALQDDSNAPRKDTGPTGKTVLEVAEHTPEDSIPTIHETVTSLQLNVDSVQTSSSPAAIAAANPPDSSPTISINSQLSTAGSSATVVSSVRLARYHNA